MKSPFYRSPCFSTCHRVALLLLSGFVGAFALVSTPATAQTIFQLLKEFDGPTGNLPVCELVEGRDGILYGTTFQGGSNTTRGTVFRVGKDGAGFQVLRHFASGAGGSRPAGGVIEASDGRLYGTTATGGTNGLTGTVFSLNRDGSDYTVLWHFTGNSPDGRQPQTGLMEGSDGLLYGTTWGAGTGTPGTVFRLRKDGTGFAVLHSFQGTGDGSLPWGTLLEGTDGAIYGTTFTGTSGTSIFGTIFRLEKDGTGYAVLRRLEAATGTAPYGGLVEGRDGVLYGTTSAAGAGGSGTVFKVEKSGAGFSVLHHFAADGSDGKEPRGTLVEGPGGALYGVTYSGGNGTNGTVFQLNKDGSNFAVLRRFAGGVGDGRGPSAGLLLGSEGALYGTSQFGGAANLGVVFRLSTQTATRPRLGIAYSTAGIVLTMTGGRPGQSYRIEAKSTLDLVSPWRAIGTNAAGVDGRLEFVDRDGPVLPARVYRSVNP